MHARHTETHCYTKQLATVTADAEKDDSTAGSNVVAPTATNEADGHAPSDVAAGRVVIAGSAAGFLSGFLGVGGGFVVVPAR